MIGSIAPFGREVVEEDVERRGEDVQVLGVDHVDQEAEHDTQVGEDRRCRE